LKYVRLKKIRQKNIPQKGHSADYSKTTFGSALASFVTDIFHRCCPFRNTPLPLVRLTPALQLDETPLESAVHPVWLGLVDGLELMVDLLILFKNVFVEDFLKTWGV